jgi:hypothetical protein
VHSTAATIHPLDAETQWARGGRTGRVAEIDRSSSSMSSGGSQSLLLRVVIVVLTRIRPYQKR